MVFLTRLNSLFSSYLSPAVAALPARLNWRNYIGRWETPLTNDFYQRRFMSLAFNPLILKKIPPLSQYNFSDLQIQKLDGWSNQNYLISLPNGSRHVLRIPKVGVEEQVDRAAELKNTAIMSGAEICPPLTYQNGDGMTLRSFAEGEVPCDEEGKIREASLLPIASLLKKVHSQTFLNPVNNLKIIEQYVQRIEHRTGQLPSSYDHILPVFREVKELFGRLQIPQSACHNDPNPRNFILTPERVLLLDWEYAGNGDPAWDLAYFITHADLTEEQEKKFLSAYFGKTESPFSLARIEVYKPFTELILSFWIRLQIAKGYHPIELSEFEDYELMGIEAAKEWIETKSFSEQLSRLKIVA